MGTIASQITSISNAWDVLNHLFGCKSKKTSKLHVTGLCEGNSPVISEFHTQRASNAENVSIWWCHHVNFRKYKNVFYSVRTRQNFQARALGAFHGRVSSAARAWGHTFSSEAMHVYMGENRFSLWSYHIGTVFESIQLSFDIYRVSNHHLVYDIHQMIGGLHNLFKFQWAITSCLSYVEYWPENIWTYACRLVVANLTFQYPASPLRILQFLFMCNDNVPLFGGGLPLDVLSILEAAGHNVVMGLWGQHLVLSGCMFTGSDRSCIFVHVLLK